MINSISENYFSTLQVVQHSCATPISNILLNLKLLGESLSINTAKKNNDYYYFSCAYLSAQYLKEIMQTSSTNQIKKQRFNLLTAINEIINIAQVPERPCQLLKFIKIDKNQHLIGSKIHFQESIICLINNAFQAYESNAENKLVILFVKKVEDIIEIKIVDGGVGFEQVENCTNQLNDCSNKYESIKMGTGLKFVHNALKKHFNADITFCSYPNKGSTVTCQFPLTK